jgi:hypothetical protein
MRIRFSALALAGALAACGVSPTAAVPREPAGAARSAITTAPRDTTPTPTPDQQKLDGVLGLIR